MTADDRDRLEDDDDRDGLDADGVPDLGSVALWPSLPVLRAERDRHAAALAARQAAEAVPYAERVAGYGVGARGAGAGRLTDRPESPAVRRYRLARWRGVPADLVRLGSEVYRVPPVREDDGLDGLRSWLGVES